MKKKELIKFLEWMNWTGEYKTVVDLFLASHPEEPKPEVKDCQKAEEIAMKHIHYYKDEIINAMQEYAKQYHKEQLRKEWIRFASYNFKEALRVNYDMEQIVLYVDEYLKDK